MSLLNSCISRVLNARNMPRYSPGMDVLQNFVACFDDVRSSGEGSDVDHLLARALYEVNSSCSYLADSCVVTPKQFWIASDLFTSAISTCPYHSATYEAAITGFESLGSWVAKRDPRSSLSLFCDFALLKLSKTLNEHLHKRFGILKVLYAFSPPDSQNHIQAIKKLQQVTSDLKIFVHCLTMLCSLETKVDISLLDLYLYYATIGLGMPSPKLRSGAVSMISSLYNQAGGMISPLLPQLTKLSQSETWWEIQGHLLALAGAILVAHSADTEDAADPETDRDTKEMQTADEAYALSIVTALFYPSAHKSVRLWGLSSLAGATGYSEQVASLYLEVLLSLDAEERRFLLGLSKSKEQSRPMGMPSSCGMEVALTPVTGSWRPLCIARAIESKIISDKLERLDVCMMEVLHGSVKSGAELGAVTSLHQEASVSDESDVFHTTLNSRWVSFFNSLKDFILVGLCDPNCVEDAAAVIAHFILKSPLQDGILTDNKLFGALRLLYPVDGTGQAGCQAAVENLFRQIYYCGDFYSGAVIGALDLFAKSYTSHYEMSNFSVLLKEFIAK